MDFDPETIRQFAHAGWEQTDAGRADVLAQAGGALSDALPDRAAVLRGARG